MSERIPARKRRTTQNYRSGNDRAGIRQTVARANETSTRRGEKTFISGDFKYRTRTSKDTNASDSVYNNSRERTTKNGKSPTIHP